MNHKCFLAILKDAFNLFFASAAMRSMRKRKMIQKTWDKLHNPFEAFFTLCIYTRERKFTQGPFVLHSFILRMKYWMIALFEIIKVSSMFILQWYTSWLLQLLSFPHQYSRSTHFDMMQNTFYQSPSLKDVDKFFNRQKFASYC